MHVTFTWTGIVVMSCEPSITRVAIKWGQSDRVWSGWCAHAFHYRLAVTYGQVGGCLVQCTAILGKDTKTFHFFNLVDDDYAKFRCLILQFKCYMIVLENGSFITMILLIITHDFDANWPNTTGEIRMTNRPRFCRQYRVTGRIEDASTEDDNHDRRVFI